MGQEDLALVIFGNVGRSWLKGNIVALADVLVYFTNFAHFAGGFHHTFGVLGEIFVDEGEV